MFRQLLTDMATRTLCRNLGLLADTVDVWCGPWECTRARLCDEINWASVGPAGHTPTCEARSRTVLTNQ